MPDKQLRTANFDAVARERLATAVKKGRRAAGFRSRAAFAARAGIGKRSLDAVETGEPTVGEDVLDLIGRTLGRYLQDWSADTPRAILVDRFEPSDTPLEGHAWGDAGPEGEANPVEHPERYPDAELFIRAVIEYQIKQGVPLEAITRAVAQIVSEYEESAAEGDASGTSGKGASANG